MMKPELPDDELASIVRSGLEARTPRRLPEHFVPRRRRSHRTGWVVAAAAGAVLLGVGAVTVAKPDLGSTVLSGLLTRLPGAAPASSPTPSSTPAHGQPPSPSRGGSAGPGGPPGAVGTPAPGATAPAPQPSAGGAPVPAPLPTLPPLPVPPPSVPLPVPTPSLPHVP